MRRALPVIVCGSLLLGGCISRDNPVIDSLEGLTPDITECGLLPGVRDGKDYVPRDAVKFDSDGLLHPDIFYVGWSQLDQRNDLRFPAKGYSGDGFEDKLFVSRERNDGTVDTWQLLPMLDKNCQDKEQIRIHSFDVAPDGRSLYVSMRRDGHSKLAIYEFDFKKYEFRKITNDNSADFINPTYVGDHQDTGNRILFVAKTVDASEIPINYGTPSSGTLLDEYDRAPTPLIHSLDVETGDVLRIGLNNSHQTEPLSIKGPDGNRLVVFTQWEHQQTTNRFSLWKTQVDGSDNFTFYGQESASDRGGANIFQAREIKSGKYQGYILMTQGRSGFLADGSVVMTKRENLDLRSERIYLEQADSNSGLNIARNPDHYNDESMVYAYRDTNTVAYGIYIKDYPNNPKGPDTAQGQRRLVMGDANFHFVQPRSFYPPKRSVTAPGEGTIGQSRTSFTNNNLNGNAGFLVQNLAQSDNGVQHQLDGMAANDLRMQFFLPSASLTTSQAVGKLGWGGSPELSVPASDFLKPKSDGSFGAILKPGLYTWKLNKRFPYRGKNLWLPVRAERQEISFVPDRVNACNQCHQERSQANIDLYSNVDTIASRKMQGNLDSIPDISYYDAYGAVPDFHSDIVPMLASCAGCHDSHDKLDLSNRTGARSQNSTWLNLVRGAHNLDNATGEVLPYVSNSINPTGFDDSYQPAPFLWSLLLDDDLSVAPSRGYPNSRSRDLDRPGDYGATYDPRVTAAVNAINAQYDHSTHWSPADVQKFITYTSTQTMVGLSDRIQFLSDGQGYTSSEAGQKAYQAMARSCFECHNDHSGGGVGDFSFGEPMEKRYRSSSDMRSPYLRFVVDSHLGNKGDLAYSPYLWQSNVINSMQRTLDSARNRIDFDQPSESQLLVYARCDSLSTDVSHPVCLTTADPDYVAMANWVNGFAGSNQAPVVDQPPSPIVIKEYDDPAFVGPITWSDPDGDYPSGDLSQLFINKSSTSDHSFNDSMLALRYDSFNSAQIETYAILGDRGNQEFEFVVSDGLSNSAVQKVPVTVTSDYVVPKPLATLPDFNAFYTVRDTGELRRIDKDGNDVSVGFIPGYSRDFTTVYRRSDTGWLYFVNQNKQKIFVVDETNASLVNTIRLNHEPNRDSDEHKQTVYLVWWRPAELDGSGNVTRPGELQGLLESKQSRNKDGDFYVGLGNGGSQKKNVVPEYRTRIKEADNAVSVYVWRRATFMTQIVGNSIDRLNVLNLVTGKPKTLGDFSFQAKTYQGTAYRAKDYFNVAAVFTSEDGAFYGVNQNLNALPTLFNFDPMEGVQVEVPLPGWLLRLMSDPVRYGTPFVVVPPRS